MEPSLLQVFECRESVGILAYWLYAVGPDTCLSLVGSLLQLALVLAAILAAKHIVMRKISAARQRRRASAADQSTASDPPGWIDGKPAIYTKFPQR